MKQASPLSACTDGGYSGLTGAFTGTKLVQDGDSIGCYRNH